MFREMRRSKQQITDEECIKILKNSKRGVLSVIGDDGYPFALPINFFYDEGDGRIYFHSAKQGHKIDAIKANSKVCFTTWNDGYRDEGDWAWRLSSVIAMGRAELITDEKFAYEKARVFGEKYFPTETELDDEMARSFNRTQIIALNIEHMTGKRIYER